MLRFCLIVICSLAVATAYAIDVQFRNSAGAWADGTSSYLYYANGQRQFVGGIRILVYVYGNQDMGGGYVRWTYDGATRYYTFPNSSLVFGAYEVLVINVETGSVTYKGQEFFYDGYVPPAVEETEEFEWTFGPEWSGSEVQVLDAEGNVLGSWYVPEGGGTIASATTATRAVLDGAGVYIDGVPVSALVGANAGTAPPPGSVERPGYAFSFDGTYQGGEWQARRPDGSVAASGSAATVGTVLEGRLTIGGNEAAEIYTRVPAGDGNGSVWVPTGVTISGSSTTYYSFVNNPDTLVPTPMPTPAPVSSPMPTPVAPSNATGTSGSVTTPTNTEENVTVDVGTVELPDNDDGEEEVINAIGEIRQLMQGIVADMGQVQGNFVSASEEFNGLRLGGVGRNCSFQMGPASINLQTSGSIRTGLTLLVIGIAGFAAASMLRNAVQ